MGLSDEEFLENEMSFCSHIFNYDSETEKITGLRKRSKPEIESIYKDIASHLVSILELLDKENKVTGHLQEYTKLIQKLKEI